MKRILLEILGGLTVIVLLASFHHQIAKLKMQNQEVATLRTLVEDAVANVSSNVQDATRMRAQIIAQIQAHLDAKLVTLEEQVAAATRGTREANLLKQQLDATRRESAIFKQKFAEDLDRTRQQVDAFRAEWKAKDDSHMAVLEKTESQLNRLVGFVMPDHRALTAQMLAPAVQLNGDDTVGSGTLIYSQKNKATSKVESYVLTAYHVVRNILTDTPSARQKGIAITIYEPTGKTSEVRGDMVAHRPAIDAALIRLRGDRLFGSVARVLTAEEAGKVQVWDEVCAVGCPLGNDPIPTNGTISSMRNELNGSNYWMINAPTYFGNSGGGVFLSQNRKLAGVFSKIYTHGRGTPVVIPHMGLFTPITLVREWLQVEKMAFVLGDQQVDHVLAAPGATPAK